METEKDFVTEMNELHEWSNFYAVAILILLPLAIASPHIIRVTSPATTTPVVEQQAK
jgi:hypothetical protein